MTRTGKTPKLITITILIILVACNLRAPFTGAGALINTISGELSLSPGMSGLLTAIPLLAFAAVSPLVVPLAERAGAGRMLLASSAVLGAGVAVRSLLGGIGVFAGTVMIGAAIAVGNVLLPAIVKSKYPQNIEAMTSLYTVVMQIVSAVSTAASVPLSIVFGWRAALGVWLVTAVFAVAVCFVCRSLRLSSADDGMSGIGGAGGSEGSSISLGGNEEKIGADGSKGKIGENSDNGRSIGSGGMKPGGAGMVKSDAGGTGVKLGRGNVKTGGGKAGPIRPNAKAGGIYRSKMTWWVTFYMGIQSLMFYSFIAWLSPMLQTKGYSDVVSGCLLSVYVIMGMAGSAALPFIMKKNADQSVTGILLGALYLAGMICMLLAVYFAALIAGILLCGFCSGTCVSFSMALFGLHTPDGQSASRLSAVAQSAGYLVASIGPVALGKLFDLTASWIAPLSLLAVAAVFLIVAGRIVGREEIIDCR